MQNDFPRTERVEFEEIYGQKRSEAFPHRNGSVFNMRERQKIVCDQKSPESDRSVFSDTRLGSIESAILQKASAGYVSLSDVAAASSDIGEVSLVYKVLEQRGVINQNYRAEDAPRHRKHVSGKVWSKRETLRLLEAIDEYGDDWVRVSEAVGRSKPDCILHFLKMDFGLNMLVSANETMAQVIFIASRVHPTVGSAAAREFMLSYGRSPNWNNIVSKAREQIEIEKSKIERLEKVILESEILKLKQKVLDYKQMEVAIGKERAEIRENILETRRKIQECADIIKSAGH